MIQFGCIKKVFDNLKKIITNKLNTVFMISGSPVLIILIA